MSIELDILIYPFGSRIKTPKKLIIPEKIYNFITSRKYSIEICIYRNDGILPKASMFADGNNKHVAYTYDLLDSDGPKNALKWIYKTLNKSLPESSSSVESPPNEDLVEDK